jgi:hypothetical protein
VQQVATVNNSSQHDATLQHSQQSQHSQHSQHFMQHSLQHSSQHHVKLEPDDNELVQVNNAREADLQLFQLVPSQFLNANKHDGAPSEDVMFVPPGNDNNAEDDGGDVHLGRTSRNDCSATFSGTPVVNIFNNDNATPLSPLSVGVDGMQPPERPSLPPASASTTTKKSKDANQRFSLPSIQSKKMTSRELFVIGTPATQSLWPSKVKSHVLCISRLLLFGFSCLMTRPKDKVAVSSRLASLESATADS